MSNEEGLELEGLDVEQPPTAAKVMEVRTDESLDYPVPNIALNEEMRRGLEEQDELVTREDHREALQKAVEEARHKERRRILEKIETLIEYGETELDRPELSDEFKKGHLKALEELEEEVSKDA